MAGAGFVMAVGGMSGLTLTQAVLGLAAGLLLMLPGHALGATGAGDVKLMAAVGAIVGPRWSSARFSRRPLQAACSR